MSGRITVEFHPDTEQYFQACEAAHPGLCAALQRDFERYIASDRDDIPERFGRDAPYTQPHSALKAGLMHIHICLPPATFPRGRVQSYRTCPDGQPDRDAALVYVQGLFDENRYCLLAVLYPDAHGMARDRGTMNFLARLAQEYRDTY